MSILAGACVLAPASLAFPGATVAHVAPPSAPPASAPPAATSGGSQSANQMSQLWDGFRTAQLKATMLQGQIAAETAKRTQLQGQIAAYTSQIAQAEARRAADVTQLGVMDGKLASLEAGIADTTAKADGMKHQVQARTIELYKQGPSSYLGMLVAAHSFRDFVSRLRFVGDIVGTDRGKLTALDQLNAQLAQQRAEAQQRRAEIAAAKAAVEAESAKIAAFRGGVTQASQSLAATVADDQTLLKGVEAQKATYLQAMAELAGESSSITTMLRARQFNQSFTWVNQRIPWPIKGPISSPFGPRINPIFGTPEFHTGIDIAVNYGLPVQVVEAGTVVSAGLMGGYGNVVIIDHGGALATLYAHLSSMAVRGGQAVAKGQRIGAIGCTGLCTGPHLHFETRIGGVPLQPLNLLP